MYISTDVLKKATECAKHRTHKYGMRKRHKVYAIHVHMLGFSKDALTAFCSLQLGDATTYVPAANANTGLVVILKGRA